MAAVNAIIRLIMSKGAQEAIKKYGSAAVKEARKHMGDLMKKPTAGQKAVEKATKSQRAARSKSRKTAVGAGAAGFAAGSNTAGNNAKRKNKVGSRTANMLNTSYRGKEMSRTDLNKRKKK